MSKIKIFEVAGCCATSSVAVSDGTVKWNANAEWVKKNGANIQRYSLAKNPQQFLSSPVIKEFLSTSGVDSPSVTLLDDKLVMAGKLPTREDIARQAGIPLSQDWSEDSTRPRCCSIPRMP